MLQWTCRIRCRGLTKWTRCHAVAPLRLESTVPLEKCAFIMVRVTEYFSKRETGLTSESAHERQRDGVARVRTVYIFVRPSVRRHVRGGAGAKLQ